MRRSGTVLLGIALAAMLAAAPVAAGGRTPKPLIEPAAAGTQCIAPPEVMRREHMNMLKHQRDDTVHGGIRAEKYSLKACIACHASQTTGSVSTKNTNFCQSCHTFAAVKIDCFECHASKPPQTSFHPLVSHGKPGDPPLGLQLRQLVVQQQVKP